MFLRKYWLPLSVFLLLIVGIGLYYLQTRPAKDPILIIKPVEPIEKPTEQPTPQAPVGDTSQGGHFHADGTFHAEPHAPTAAVSNRSTFTPIAFADGVHPTSVSSNPLFKDGVPEHLQCPPELIGVYMKTVPPEWRERLLRIGAEILEKYNPNRPLTEVYPAFIEAEKWYHENADPEQAGISQGANRMDWQHQLILDFPEIGMLLHEDTDRAFAMRRVELGHWSPDFNRGLINGRPFRTDADKQYMFTWSRYTETEDGFETGTGTYKTGPSNGDPNAEVVHINMDKVSDKELEQLSGWNYNINPYTTGAYKLGDKK